MIGNDSPLEALKVSKNVVLPPEWSWWWWVFMIAVSLMSPFSTSGVKVGKTLFGFSILGCSEDKSQHNKLFRVRRIDNHGVLSRLVRHQVGVVVALAPS